MEEDEAVGSVDQGSFVVSVFISAEQGMDLDAESSVNRIRNLNRNRG